MFASVLAGPGNAQQQQKTNAETKEQRSLALEGTEEDLFASDFNILDQDLIAKAEGKLGF